MPLISSHDIFLRLYVFFGDIHHFRVNGNKIVLFLFGKCNNPQLPILTFIVNFIVSFKSKFCQLIEPNLLIELFFERDN